MADPAKPTARPIPFVLGGSLRSWWREPDGRWARLALPALLTALIALPLRGLFVATGSSMEEGFMLVFPSRVLRGDVPNVDFLHLYGPFSLHVLAGWYALFGATLTVQRWFGLVQHLGVITALWTLAAPWGRRISFVSASIATLLLLTPIGLSALAWEGGVALAAWAVVIALRATAVADPRQRRRLAAVAGALAGAALGYRPDLVVALALSTAVIGWTAARAADRRTLSAHWLFGLAIGLIPSAVHVALAGPRASWRGMLVDPVVHLRPGRQLPRPPSFGQIDGALQAVAEGPLDAPWWRLPALAANHQLWLWFWVVVLVAPLLAVVAWRLQRHAVLVAGAALGLGMLPQALQRPDSTHLAWGSAVSCALVPCAIAQFLGTRTQPSAHSRPLRSPLVWSVCAAAVLCLVVAPYYTLRPYLFHTRVSVGDKHSGYEVSRDGRSFYFGNEALQVASQAAIDDLDAWSGPGQRLLVGPADLSRTVYSDAIFYHLFPELEPATYFIEMDPGLADRPGSSLAHDVESADWLLLTNFWTGWFEPNTSIRFGSTEPNEVVARHFCLAGDYSDGLVLLFRRCSTGDGLDPSRLGIGAQRWRDLQRELAERGIVTNG
ncbi:MAG: hypothetical protein ACO3C1_10485 [Ilumatobacteraceae bacterium]